MLAFAVLVGSLIAIPIIGAVILDASPYWLGVLAAAGQLPALLFGLLAGAWLVYIVNAVSLRQQHAVESMQGRHHATFAFVAHGVQPIGSILGGVVASVIGLSMTLVVMELGMFIAVIWLVLSPLR